MPQSYYQAVAGVLEAGSVFKLYYPNYCSLMSTAQALPKEEQAVLIYQLNR
jgi:hypothetical protein